MSRAYYNEIDPYAAQWLRNLIDAGHIAPGDVDTRSIADVQPVDLIGYTQCHFFAGIGGWSYALRLAGWPDDRPVWTGSCPCQPFSAAGKRRGTADERHLWPEFRRLIAVGRPAVVFGEQVASKDGRLWLAGVRTDLEDLGYAVGAADLCAAGVGAPHIRQRLWWVADADGRRAGHGNLQRGGQHGLVAQDCGFGDGGVGDTSRPRLAQRSSERCDHEPQLAPTERTGGDADRLADHHHHHRREGLTDARLQRSEISDTDGRGKLGGLGDSCGSRSGGNCTSVPRAKDESSEERGAVGHQPDESVVASDLGRMADAERDAGESGGLANQSRKSLEAAAGRPSVESGRRGHLGFWSDFDIIPCLDGKARRIEPGSFPLAHGVPNRVGRLRAYGNAINPYVAAEFIAAFSGCDLGVT